MDLYKHICLIFVFLKSLKLWSPIYVDFSLFVVCQDFIANTTDDAVVPDIFDETPNELPATPPPTAVNAAGNDGTCLYIFALYYILAFETDEQATMLMLMVYLSAYFIVVKSFGHMHKQ